MSMFDVSREVNHRAVFPRRDELSNWVFLRERIRGSGDPCERRMTLNWSEGRRLTISFTVRFWAFVFASSAKDGVKIVIIRLLRTSSRPTPSWSLDYRKPRVAELRSTPARASGEIVCTGRLEIP